MESPGPLCLWLGRHARRNSVPSSLTRDARFAHEIADEARGHFSAVVEPVVPSPCVDSTSTGKPRGSQHLPWEVSDRPISPSRRSCSYAPE